MAGLTGAQTTKINMPLFKLKNCLINIKKQVKAAHPSND